MTEKKTCHTALDWGALQIMKCKIPACAGMTREDAGMTREDAGMTREDAGMTKEDVGMTKEDAGMTK